MIGAMNLTEYIVSKGGTGTLQCTVLAALALRAGCSRNTLYMIAKGHKAAGAKLAGAIEASTDGLVTRNTLRPDYFGATELDSAA